MHVWWVHSALTLWRRRAIAAGAAGLLAKIVASEVSRKFLSSVLLWIGTPQCGRQVSSLLGRFVLDVTRQNEMLLNVQEGNMSSFQAACNFMKTNKDIWSQWIPPVQFRHYSLHAVPRRPIPTTVGPLPLLESMNPGRAVIQLPTGKHHRLRNSERHRRGYRRS